MFTEKHVTKHVTYIFLLNIYFLCYLKYLSLQYSNSNSLRFSCGFHFFMNRISLLFSFSVNFDDILKQAKESLIIELWKYFLRLSGVGRLPLCHGNNDGRIELFARKSDVEMFHLYSLVFLLSFKEIEQAES